MRKWEAGKMGGRESEKVTIENLTDENISIFLDVFGHGSEFAGVGAGSERIAVACSGVA